MPPDIETQDYIAVEPTKKKTVIIVIIAVILLSAGGVIWLVLGKGSVDGPETAQTPAASVTAVGQGVFPHDKDGDGLSDGEELKLGTSDSEFDTDGDGLADVIEISVWKTNPANADSDGDGFADGYEVINGFNPAGAGKL